MTIEQLERAVALSAKSVEGDGPKWIQIAIVGQWAGHPSGPFQLTVRHFDEIVRNFRATKNRKIPIDFEHVSEMDPREGEVPTRGAPAQGWMIDLDNRGEIEGLWALADWKEPARTYIREEKYQFFSPTIRFNPKDPVTGERRGARLSSGALTNQPFLDGMMPVAAKDTDVAGEEPAQKDEDIMTAEQIQKLLEEKATLTARVAAADAEIAALKTSAAEVTLSLKDVTSKLEAAEKAAAETAEVIKTLSAEKALIEKQTVDDRVSLAFNTYKDEKKLGDADREAMVLTLKSNPELFERLYPKPEPGKGHLLRNLTGEGAPNDRKTLSADKGDEPVSIVALADKIQAEKKCDRDTAFAMAERQLRTSR